MTNEGSFFAENSSLSFGTWFRIFRKPNQELLYQTTFWCGLVLNGLHCTYIPNNPSPSPGLNNQRQTVHVLWFIFWLVTVLQRQFYLDCFCDLWPGEEYTLTIRTLPVDSTDQTILDDSSVVIEFTVPGEYVAFYSAVTLLTRTVFTRRQSAYFEF